ncbi:histidine kinase [Pedobacter sp. B4-66]|uniref:sensor histidine kinase n=1 Tax=Pedobacter sp. B4-66 TaxID=2817280 RepID=UPI001BD949D7|nr:histidine kinase [Pedobacter sp. B4-66]
MPLISRSGYKQILLHFVAITVFICFEILYLSTQGKVSVQSSIIRYSYEIVFFYFSAFLLLPKIWIAYSNQWYRIFFVALIIAFYTVCLCIVGLINLSIKQGHIITEVSGTVIIICSWRAFYITLLTIAYSLGRFNIAKTKEAYEHKMRKIDAETKMENNFIRSQVNPHLLFNSLSFLYTKALKETPDVANTIYLLVCMSEYALANEKEDDQVMLENEILQMQRYVELQQTLHNYRLHVTMNLNLPDYDLDIFLPPLLFINFIENVFKYGNLNDQHSPARIEFQVDERTLKFSTTNKVENLQQALGKGIGSANAQARIKKHYGDQSEIVIFHADNIYTVEITIKL